MTAKITIPVEELRPGDQVISWGRLYTVHELPYLTGNGLIAALIRRETGELITRKWTPRSKVWIRAR